MTISLDAIRAAWETIADAADAHAFGGAVCLIDHQGDIVFRDCVGYAIREPESDRTPMRDDAIFDLASITKCVATLPLALQLIDSGHLELDAPLGQYLPEFGTSDAKVEMTIRRLLSHSSGMISWRGVFEEGAGYNTYVRSLASDQPESVPGTKVEYSCMGFIALAAIIERITGEPLDDLATTRVFGPLGMTDTGFRPSPDLRERIVATELGNGHETTMTRNGPRGGWRSGLIRGEVHDGNAWYGFGGVSGNAGLFGTADDLLSYARMWRNHGELHGQRILSQAIVSEATGEQTGLQAPNDRRGLGWQMVPHPDDTSAPNHSGSGLSQMAYGHTGFTGTSLWIDPERDLIIILLTNRVHPTVNPAYLPIRANFTRAIVTAVS